MSLLPHKSTGPSGEMTNLIKVSTIGKRKEREREERREGEYTQGGAKVGRGKSSCFITQNQDTTTQKGHDSNTSFTPPPLLQRGVFGHGLIVEELKEMN